MDGGDGEQSNKIRKTEVADRISSLPDSILHEIFSSVDIKQTVQTSVLSRRWRYFWTSHPYLNFEFRKMIRAENTHAQIRKIVAFIARVLYHRDQSIGVTRSRFSVFFDLTPDFLDVVITYLVESNVEQLHLHAIASTDRSYQFPSCFYTCDSLTELHLECSYSVCLSDASLNMPNLKKLHLKGFTFWDHEDDDDDDVVLPFEMGPDDGYDILNKFFLPREDCIINDIFSNCLKLECLILEKCDFYRLNVSLPLLKRLEVQFKSDYGADGDVVIELDTPLLDSFKLEGGASVVLSTKSELSCLDKLHMNLYLDSLQLFDDGVHKRVLANLTEMLQKLGNASTVVLAPETAEILAWNPIFHTSYPSLFCGLTNLKILEPRKNETLPFTEVVNVCRSYKKAPFKYSCDVSRISMN